MGLSQGCHPEAAFVDALFKKKRVWMPYCIFRQVSWRFTQRNEKQWTLKTNPYAEVPSSQFPVQVAKNLVRFERKLALCCWVIGVLFATSARAQTVCDQPDPGPIPQQMNVGPIPCANPEVYSGTNNADYQPTSDSELLTVRVTLHIMQRADGTDNFQENDPAHTAYLNSIFGDVNGVNGPTLNRLFGQIDGPMYGGVAQPPTVTDSKVRFVLDDILYWADDRGYRADVPDVNGVDICHPATRYLYDNFKQKDCSSLQVYFIGRIRPNTNSVAGCGNAYDGEGSNYMVVQNVYNEYVLHPAGGPWPAGALGGDPHKVNQLVAHELGHCMGLHHAWFSWQHTLFPDLHWPASTASWCDPYDVGATNCSNNMMGPSRSLRWLSNLQIGHIRQKLLSSWRSKWLVSCVRDPLADVHITADETWAWARAVPGDVVVSNGATLTVKCKVNMPMDGKFIVEPGSRLLVDGGWLTSNCCQNFWGGIEVWGTSNQHQYPIDNPTHQGLVVLTNGAVIEHAREAIRLWKPQDWNSMGGVVQVKGTSGNPGALFLNCRRSVEFMAYQNFQPGNPSLLRPNFSSFTYADFKVDDDYRGGHDFEAHVTMWGVDGIVFRACNFENAQTTGPNSWQLGEGIFSLDANYSVGANCTVALPYGVPCPPENLDRGTVKGLGHGIDARDSGSGRGFAAGSLDFENNVVGIYAEGLPGFSAVNNDFIVGNRNVELVGAVDGNFQQPFHRGISTQLSYGFRVEENDIVRAGDVLAEGVDGIVIENSGAHSTEVYGNTARDLDNGYIAEGNCLDWTQASSVGHQFLCNQNLGNGQNFWVRHDGGNTSFHSIRTQQGSKDVPAGNTFDQLGDERDYKNGTSWVVNYWHSGGNEEPIYVTPGWLVTTQTNDASGCPSRSEGRELRLTPELTSEVRNDFDVAKEAYISTAYVYKSLLDGGNTQAVVDEVQESWPQEAWDLRNYLMSKSPYLSTTVLMEVMKKNTLPQAMVLEICLANPEATKKESFIKWAEYEAPNPLPGYMIDLIAGSWDERTFRMELEAQMGQHHADMSVAADILQASYRADEETIPLADMLDQWNKMPNYGARFAEVEMHLRMKQFEQAKTILNSLAARYTLKEEREAERDRAIWYIDRLQGLAGEGRSIMQFSTTEVAELTTFAETASDIPGTWVRNILCFGYQICLPHGEGVGGGNKALKPRKDVPNTTSDRVLEVMPNPASAWATIAYDLGMETNEAFVRILDARGKEVALLPAMAAKGQLLWDTRTVPSGVYAIELFRSKERVSTRRLVVQPAP